jgi:hypothetical protein
MIGETISHYRVIESCIVFTAKQEGHGARINVQKSITGTATPISPEGIDPEGASYIYGYHRSLSDPYLVEGLK